MNNSNNFINTSL